MDNASKALIIAGAILIAVMLVSLGVMLYNTAAGVAETTIGSVEALGVSGFNAQFETYLGTGKSKSQAVGLISKVIANNANNDVEIKIGGKTSVQDLSATRDSINAKKNKVYDISVGNYYKDGTIESITITEKDK